MALAASLLIGVLWPLESPGPELLSRTDVGLDSIALALLRFDSGETPGLFGNRDELIREWRDKLGMTTEAARNFDTALAARPQDAELLYWRGVSRIALGEFDGARADLEQAEADGARHDLDGVDGQLAHDFFEDDIARAETETGDDAGDALVDHLLVGGLDREQVGFVPGVMEIRIPHGRAAVGRSVDDEGELARRAACSLLGASLPA